MDKTILTHKIGSSFFLNKRLVSSSSGRKCRTNGKNRDIWPLHKRLSMWRLQCSTTYSRVTPTYETQFAFSKKYKKYWASGPRKNVLIWNVSKIPHAICKSIKSQLLGLCLNFYFWVQKIAPFSCRNQNFAKFEIPRILSS